MRKKQMSIASRKNIVGYAFMAPFLVLLITFVVAPVFVAGYLSLTSYNMLEPAKFIGLDNFKSLLLDDDIFMVSLRNTFMFALFIGPISYLMSFFMAWVLDGLKFRNVFSLAFYAPSIVSGVAMTIVWGTFFSNDRFGYINNILLSLGIVDSPILWNQDAAYIFPVVILISVWTSMGTGFLVFLAGLQNLPQEVFESGRIDGIQNRWQELGYLTFPLMKPQLLFGAITAIVGSFGVFDVAVQFAGMPSPNYAAHTIVAHLYDHAFIRFEMGYASAVAVILFAITYTLGRICMKVLHTDD